MVKFQVATSSREELVNVTDLVEEAVRRSGVASGVAVVYTPHTTAAVTINENADPDVRADVIAGLRALVPRNLVPFRHSEGNSDAHLKASLVGPSVQVIFADGHLALGVWQAIYLCEFDGPRHREIWVQVVASS